MIRMAGETLELGRVRNEDESKRFLNWLLSLDATALYGQRAEMSAVPGAKPTPDVLKAGLPEDVSSVLYPMDFGWSVANKNRVLDEWKKRFER